MEATWRDQLHGFGVAPGIGERDCHWLSMGCRGIDRPMAVRSRKLRKVTLDHAGATLGLQAGSGIGILFTARQTSI